MRFLTEFAFAFGRMVATTLKGASNAILANIELLDAGDGAVEGSSEEPVFGPIGFYSRPMPPVGKDAATGLNPEGEAEVFAVREGDQVIPLVGRDLRLNKQVNPKDGTVGMVHYSGGFVEITYDADKRASVITMYALRKKSDGTADKASVFTINANEADSSIIMLHEKGQALTMTPDGDVLITSPAGDAYVQVRNDGHLVLNGVSLVVAGGALVGGTTGGEPVMLSAQQLAWVAEVNAWIAQMNAWVATVNAFQAGVSAVIAPVGPGGTPVNTVPNSPAAPPWTPLTPAPTAPVAVPAPSLWLKAV